MTQSEHAHSDAARDQSLTKLPTVSNVPSLIVVTPTHTAQRILREQFESQSAEPLASRGFLADAIPWMANATYALVGPVLGRPAVRTAIEPLLASGGSRVLLFGVAGGLYTKEHPLQIADAVCAEKAIEAIDTSLAAAPPRDTNAKSEFQNEIANRLSDYLAYKELLGVWTTDNPYRECRQQIESFISNGAHLVEMEYAALTELAIQYDIEVAAAFVVSDVLRDTWETGFSSKEVKEKLAVVAQVLAEHLVST